MERGRSHTNAAATAGRFLAGLGWTSDNIYSTQKHPEGASPGARGWSSSPMIVAGEVALEAVCRCHAYVITNECPLTPAGPERKPQR